MILKYMFSSLTFVKNESSYIFNRLKSNIKKFFDALLLTNHPLLYICRKFLQFVNLQILIVWCECLII
ncbi:MAG: hypothetical protein EA358_08460 [Flavobacteriales bacterium]|nr:MAG: hypothetical protein EA358_08460 [Flavobacteriales bacterium]